MNEQEMLDRIAQLESELEQIKNKKRKVSIIDAFSEKYPWVKRMRYRAGATDTLSKLVRSVCFPEIEKDHMHNYRNGHVAKMKYDYIIQTKDMTDEEKGRFLEIVGRILEVLDDYETISTEVR